MVPGKDAETLLFKDRSQMMHKDFYSTATLSGAHEKALRSAIESEMRKKQNGTDRRAGDAHRKVRISLHAHLKQSFGNLLRPRATKVEVQTPAE